MLARSIAAGLLLVTVTPALARGDAASRPEQPGFEQRVVAILNAGGTVETIQSRLDRVGSGLPLTADQRTAVDALRLRVRGKAKVGGPSLAEAEAFAARNPDSPASAILLAEAALSNEQPLRSADALIAAAGRAGPLVELVSPVTVSKLTGELDKLSEKRRTADLAKALLNAGWSRGSASLRSFLALEAIRDEIRESRFEEARRLLPIVASPASLHLILIDHRLASLRADVSRLAGPRLERAWREYLTRTRDEWLGRGDLQSAVAYAEALRQANQHEALVATFLPRFIRGYNCPSDFVARSMASDLADGLAKLGRWTKAEDVMRRSGGVSTAVYATMLLERGEFGRANTYFDRSLKATAHPREEDDVKGIAWLHAARDCARFRSGIRSDPSPYDPKLVELSSRLFVALCMDRTADARAMLTAALDGEQERADALRWVQPFTDPPLQSAFRKDMNSRIRALQQDPGVIEQVSKHGAILDWTLTAAAPGATELAAASKAAAPWRCGEDSNWRVDLAQPESIRLPDSQP